MPPAAMHTYTCTCACQLPIGTCAWLSADLRLRRLLVAEQYAISRRSAGPNGKPAAEASYT